MEELEKDARAFRDKIIKKEPANETEESLREKFIEQQRNNPESVQIANSKIKSCYEDIKEVLKKYIVMKEEYYSLIAIWIIGTHFHSKFSAFPYLYLNAMRGSAKTRTLKLIISLSKDGLVMASPTEAVLFRTNGTLGIDEFEGVANKDKSTIREMLNASYKKGIKILRMKKKRSILGEEQVVEEFEPYRPIVMANISGMDEVLGDRSIPIILEKSNDPIRTKLTEDYENDDKIKEIREILKNWCSLCSVVTEKNIYISWNNYIIDKHNYTLNTLDTLTTLTTQTTLHNIKIDKLFNKIDESGIYGRSLELFLPLFFISYMISEEVFEEMLGIAMDMVSDKSHEEETESQDVMVLDFVSKKAHPFEFYHMKHLTREFKEFIDYEPEQNNDWLNSKWFGKALKRLNLIIDKKRKARGIEVTLNGAKAVKQLQMFGKK